jgi:predicted MFS family arabinose efflux permease
MFALYAALGLANALLYLRLPPAPAAEQPENRAPLDKSRRTVLKLTALFSVDAFGGGFAVQSLIALWLFQRFDLSLVTAGSIFFWTGICTALSYPVAAWLAGRIGLVNTMVYTHLPANVFVMLVPFMPTLELAIALLLARSALSSMDIPARSSYVMAVVSPGERAAAAGVTTVARSIAGALSPGIAGWLMTVSAFGWPLVICGALKIGYDLALLAMFRRVRPPEES